MRTIFSIIITGFCLFFGYQMLESNFKTFVTYLDFVLEVVGLINLLAVLLVIIVFVFLSRLKIQFRYYYIYLFYLIFPIIVLSVAIVSLLHQHKNWQILLDICWGYAMLSISIAVGFIGKLILTNEWNDVSEKYLENK